MSFKGQVGVFWVHTQGLGGDRYGQQEAAWNRHLLLKVCHMWRSRSESPSMCLEMRWEAGLEGFVVFVESIFHPEKILGATKGSKQGAMLPALHSRKTDCSERCVID